VRESIARWPFRIEVAVVLAIAFGTFIVSGLLHLLHPTTLPPINEAALIGLLIIEPILAALTFGFLWLRGWRFGSLGLRPSLMGTVEGVALALVTWISLVLIFYLAQVFVHLDARQWGLRLVAPGISPWLALANSIVNPLFEELFVAGYVVTTMKQLDKPWLGINLSAGMRLSYHLYQGQRAILSVLPLGLIFAGWYKRTGRLWPLVVAHAIFDFTALMAAR
jgi:CAAX protease family protein